ncbi:MAG: hypothetical protein ABMB14_32110 [Myxococcota bacterium]
MAAGVVLVLALHLGVGAALWVALMVGDRFRDSRGLNMMASLTFGWLLTLPFSQLPYLVPAFVVAGRVRRTFAIGIALGAVLTVVLYFAACAGLLARAD